MNRQKVAYLQENYNASYLRVEEIIHFTHLTSCKNNKYLTPGIMQIHSGALLIRVVIHWFPTL